MTLDDHKEIIEIVRHTAGQTADRFHLLRLAQLKLQMAALADILSDHKTDAPTGIDELVRGFFDFEGLPILVLMEPEAVLFGFRSQVPQATFSTLPLPAGMDIEDGHLFEFGGRVTVLLDRGLVHAQ